MVEKSLHEVINFNKRMGKILIAGDEGSGKTLFSVCLAVEKMLRGMQDCWDSYRKVDEYNKLGFHFSKNYKHLVAANFDINCRFTKIPSFKSYKVDPFKLGLHSEDYETQLYPPGTHLFIDEAHVPLNAYMWQYVRPEVTAFHTTARQYDISLIMATNRPNMVVNTIRDLCNRIFYFYKDCEEIKKDNEVVGHRFFCLEFDTNAAFEQYLKNGKKDNCQEYTIRVNHCRYYNYDDKQCRFLHVKGREFTDFVMEHFEEIKSIEDINEFVRNFGVGAPEGYYIKPSDRVKQDKKEEKQQQEKVADWI